MFHRVLNKRAIVDSPMVNTDQLKHFYLALQLEGLSFGGSDVSQSDRERGRNVRVLERTAEVWNQFNSVIIFT